MAARILFAALLCSSAAQALDVSRLPRPHPAPPRPATARKALVQLKVKPLSRIEIDQALGHAATLYKLPPKPSPGAPFSLSVESPAAAGKGSLMSVFGALYIYYAQYNMIEFNPRAKGEHAVFIEIQAAAGTVYLFDCSVEAKFKYRLRFKAAGASEQALEGAETGGHFLASTFSANAGMMRVTLDNADDKAYWGWGGCTVTPAK